MPATTRILIIDDNPDIRALLEDSLRPAGYEVCVAANGSEALKQFTAAPADLVITDLFMPGLDGFETISQLRHRFGKVPILAISGHDNAPTFLTMAGNIGAVGVLQKPFTPEELLAEVRRILHPDPH